MKKQLKPWLLQYQWKSEKDFDKYSWRTANSFYSPKWMSGRSVYADPERAKKNLEHRFLDNLGSIYSRGRNWRLFNKSEQKVLSVIVENKTITLI